MARPLRPNLPPPLELNGRWNVGTLKKKVTKKVFFFLNGPALYQPPSPLNCPAIKRRTFTASLINLVYLLVTQTINNKRINADYKYMFIITYYYNNTIFFLCIYRIGLFVCLSVSKSNSLTLKETDLFSVLIFCKQKNIL